MMNALSKSILLLRLPTKPVSGTQRYLPPSRLLSSIPKNENPGQSYEGNTSIPLDKSLLNKKASVRRTFSPNCNAQAMLVCGGPSLAAHASFDPEYARAKSYIQNHPVGPAVLSPILISGLVGALIESTLPQSFFVSGTMNQLKPLIVGVEVEASIKVTSVVNSCNVDSASDGSDAMNERYHGHELLLDTEVKRVSDGVIISNGNQKIWLPDYGN